MRNSTNKFIKEDKLAYYSNLGNKLSDPKIGQKLFWSAYKKVVDKKRTTNIPLINENGIFISNFKKKADIINE